MANLFNDDHKYFFTLLNKHHVDYLLIGGYAVNLYGYNRTTGDVDIWIGSSSDNKIKIIKALEEFGYETEPFSHISLDEMTMFSLGARTEFGHIELTNRIAGINFNSAFESVQSIIFEGVDIKCIHINDLIKNKKASGRLKDLDDVEQLTKVLKNKP